MLGEYQALGIQNRIPWTETENFLLGFLALFFEDNHRKHVRMIAAGMNMSLGQVSGLVGIPTVQYGGLLGFCRSRKEIWYYYIEALRRILPKFIWENSVNEQTYSCVFA
jgi:hypothetical protein